MQESEGRRKAVSRKDVLETWLVSHRKLGFPATFYHFMRSAYIAVFTLGSTETRRSEIPQIQDSREDVNEVLQKARCP